MANNFGSIQNQLKVTNQIKQTSIKEKSNLDKLSTGKKNDPFENVKIENLGKAIKGLEEVNKSLEQTDKTLQTASGGLNAVLGNLQDLRQTAVRAADSNISSSERFSLQQSADSSVASINATTNAVSFNDQKLINGDFENKSVPTGSNPGDSMQVSIDDASAQAIGVSDINLGTPTSANSAITAIDNAITQVVSSLAKIGSTQERVQVSQRANQSALENLSSAKSSTEDVDIAKVTSQVKATEIKKKSQMELLKAIDQQAQLTISLLKD